LDDFVERPLELLREIIRTLDGGSRSALALVFMRGGALASPVKMTKEEEQAVALLGGSVAAVRSALSALDGSLLLPLSQGGSQAWRFKHPTIRDAFAALTAEDRELMDIYLAGASVEKMFSEVSCGHVAIEGIKVEIPCDRYDALMVRMDAPETRKIVNEWDLHRFLAYRCDRSFLAKYIALHPEFLEGLRASSYLYAVSDMRVIMRLKEFGLLPEEKRHAVVRQIRALAVDTPDSGFLHGSLSGLLTDEESNEILDHVRARLLPNLDKTISEWRSNYDGKDEPESYFEELTDALRRFREEMLNDPKAMAEIDVALGNIASLINELRSEMPQEPDSDDFYDHGSRGTGNHDFRSIFDDVDQ
jgi:hypothetical protein